MIEIKNNQIFFSIDSKNVLIKASFAFDAPDACAILSNITFVEDRMLMERDKLAARFYEELKENISEKILDNRQSNLLIYAPSEIIKMLRSAGSKQMHGSYNTLMIRFPNASATDVLSIADLTKYLNVKKIEIIEDKKILSDNAKELCQLMIDGAHWARNREYTPEFLRKLIEASTTSTALRIEYQDGRVEWPGFVRNIASTDDGLFYISDMCTHPNYQNKGIGGLVLQANLKNISACATGLLTVSSVYPGNIAGKKLYKKFGFIFHGEYLTNARNARMQLCFEYIPSKALANQLYNFANIGVANTAGQFLFAPRKENLQSASSTVVVDSAAVPDKVASQEQGRSLNK